MDKLFSILLDARFLPIITGMLGWGIATAWAKWQRSKERKEDAISLRKSERKRDDFEHYKILITMYQAFLAMAIPHVDLRIQPDQKDRELAKGSADHARRQILYEYLFYMFERAYMLKPAMEDPERLGSDLENRWEGWEIWITSYLRKKSMQEEFESVKDYGLNESFQTWIKKKIRELRTEAGGPIAAWETVAPDR